MPFVMEDNRSGIAMTGLQKACNVSLCLFVLMYIFIKKCMINLIIAVDQLQVRS